MPKDNLTKEALPEFLKNVRSPGNFVADWFVNKFKVGDDGTGLLDKIHDADLSSKYQKAIAGLDPTKARGTMMPERIAEIGRAHV